MPEVVDPHDLDMEWERIPFVAFDHHFIAIDDSLFRDLGTLEREGAIYADHWIEELQDFRHVRIPFAPEEISEFVRRSKAYDLFLQAGSPRRAADVDGVPLDVAEEADRYSMVIGDREIRPWHCPAAFYGSDLESLICSNQRATVIESVVRGDDRSGYSLTILEALTRGEDQSVEFVQEIGKQARDLAKEVAAFSTSNDGIILLGVTDAGEAIGTTEKRERIEGIVKVVEPMPTAGVEVAEYRGVPLAILRIKKGPEPIYYVDHRPYLRQGSSSRPASAHEVRQLIEEHSTQDNHAER